jgi:hypothetical protein
VVVLDEAVEDLLSDGAAIDVTDTSWIQGRRLVAERPAIDSGGSRSGLLRRRLTGDDGADDNEQRGQDRGAGAPLPRPGPGPA